MNWFDELANKRSLLSRDFIPTWLEFRRAVEEHVASYNNLSEGLEHPAKIKNASETSTVVSCQLGRTKEEGYLLTVVVAILCNRSAYFIEARIEKWLQPPDSVPYVFGAPNSMRFELKAELGETPGSGRTWLEYERQKVTVAVAVVSILNAALLSDAANTF